jgi:tetratricopeptide (TPR) repeat protein
VGVGGYLIMQTIDKSMDINQGLIIYCPLLFCWGTIAGTIGGPLNWVAWIAALGSVAWVVTIFLKGSAEGAVMKRRAAVERVAKWSEFSRNAPQDTYFRFKLAEALEDTNRHREAYEQYSTIVGIDPKNNLARHRARELYEQITGKPMPGSPPASSGPTDGGNLPAFSPERADQTVPIHALHGAAAGVVPAPAAAPEPIAIRSLRDAVEEEPSDAARHAALADALIHHGKPAEALPVYRKAVWLDPSNDRYRCNLQAVTDALAAGPPVPPPASAEVTEIVTVTPDTQS